MSLKSLPIFTGLLLFGYILARAIILPITHDESGTCLVFSTQSVSDIVSYAQPIPNNHILNTLLVKLFSQLFGWHPLIVRLPNVLAFILYFFSGLAILRLLNRNLLFVMSGLVALNFNPFLLDFFSLARGYGLSISFMMASIYFGLRFIRKPGPRWSLAAMIFAAAAVYSNFTTIHFYLALSGLLIAVFWLKRKSNSRNNNLLSLLNMIIVSIVLAGASYGPVTKMMETNQFVFWASDGFYENTIKSLLVSSLYDSGHFGIPIYFFTVPLAIVFVIMLVMAVWSWKNKWLEFNISLLFFLLIFILTIAIGLAQHYLLGTPYLSGRTAVFLYPLYALCLIGLAHYLIQHKRKMHVIYAAIILVLGGVHLLRSANFNHCYEWWYDANTTEILSWLEKNKNPDKPVTLNTHWWFAPSFEYYRVTQKLDWLILAPYHKDPQPELTYDYYYSVSDETSLLEKTYTPVLYFDWKSRMLMKRKNH